MYAFKYQRAESVGAANAALSADASAKVLSGGMTLLPSMKHRLAAPTALIDVARLPEMTGVRQEGDHWWVGAATRHQDVAAHAGLQQDKGSANAADERAHRVSNDFFCTYKVIRQPHRPGVGALHR